MLYTPHLLQIWKAEPSSKNEEGNLVLSKGEWQDLCFCRCDDNGSQKTVAVAGIAKVYNYHIVFEKQIHKFDLGEKTRVLDEDKNIRAEGTVIRLAKTNFLNYQELYL